MLDELAQLGGKGLHAVAARMSESFSADPIRLPVERYSHHLGQQRDVGTLFMGATGLLTATSGVKVPQHTFHGDHADPRR